jgi:glycyl-tRNA synthetase
LMFKTFMGPLEDESAIVFLRPETAQGIYVNFLNVQGPSRQKIPFGIAQIGKAFRNEITTKNFIFRTREFEQMEMQFFIKPDEDDKWFEYWRDERVQFYKDLGINSDRLHLHEHAEDELAHYAKRAVDIEYEFPFGTKELEGIHNRTDYDLSHHMDTSGKDLRYYDQAANEKYLPYIIETSAGCDRTILVILLDAYNEEEVKGEKRVVLKINPLIAPVKVGVFPLVKKDGMPEIALDIYHDLKKHYKCFYDDGGAVGRRYRRQDEAGTPYCVTVDGQTKEDNTVTVRDRDSMEQFRVKIEDLAGEFRKRLEI